MPSKRKSGATDAESKRQRAATLADEASEFLCPITLELPLDPVTAADGHIYERSAIERHMATQGAALRSPMLTYHEYADVANATRGLAGPGPQSPYCSLRLITHTTRTPITTHHNDLPHARSGQERNRRESTREACGSHRRRQGQAVAAEARREREVGPPSASSRNGRPRGDAEPSLSLLLPLKHQPEEAFHYAKIAADLGNARGLQKAGFALCHGKGVCKNQANGVALLAAAAGAGHGYAAYELGRSFLSGWLGLSRDASQARLWLDQTPIKSKEKEGKPRQTYPTYPVISQSGPPQAKKYTWTTQGEPRSRTSIAGATFPNHDLEP